jgi:hypothetical protein
MAIFPDPSGKKFRHPDFLRHHFLSNSILMYTKSNTSINFSRAFKIRKEEISENNRVNMLLLGECHIRKAPITSSRLNNSPEALAQ